jgi:hypothetical protein
MGEPRTTRRARSDTRSNTLTGDQQCILELKLPEEKGGSAMTKETTGSNKPDVQDEHAPSNIGPGTANKSEDREKKSQLEGPAAYAPHDESEKSNR